MKKWLLYFNVLCCSLSALDKTPWLKTPYEFYFITLYEYSRFNQVADSKKNLAAPSNDHRFAFDLSVAPLPTVDVEIELEVVDTPRQSWGYRSSALQVRWQWWDDIQGDPVSGTFGCNLREVSTRSLEDVSSPYHAKLNLEVNAAIGKEWAKGAEWSWRTWGEIGCGMGNWGALFWDWLVALEKKWGTHHVVTSFIDGYFGCGHREKVSINRIFGWGKYQHRSIDVRCAYRYHFPRYGNLSIEGFYRPYAHVFPEHVWGMSVVYQLPFSIL